MSKFSSKFSGQFLISLQRLQAWFFKNQRILPWRSQPSPYRVWVSEIMLQQTQVATVIPYFERFIKQFPRLDDLAQAEEEEVLKLWAGLGYYSRARNLHRAAQKMVLATLPRTREGWLGVPGVGPYTAGAILSIAFNQVEPILDGNVERVLSRVRRCSRQKGDTAFKSRLWKLSDIFVRQAQLHQIQPRVLNQALMELGATLCTPKKPQCLNCPLKSVCRAYQKGDPEAYPPKKSPKKWLQVKETLHCLVSSSGKVLLQKRQKGQWRAGLWDLLEVEPSQIDVNLQPVYQGQVHTRHIVTRHKIDRKTQVWRLNTPLLRLARGVDSRRWVCLEDPEVPVGSAVRKTLQAVQQILEPSL